MIKTIDPVGPVQADVRLPGSKSITHRALLLAALADGESRVANALRAEDTLLTAGALAQVGVTIVWEAGDLRVASPARRWHTPAGPILLGNSGTSMRLLLGVLAAGRGTFVLDGSPRLRERPIGPIVAALAGQGLQCRYLGNTGFPPVEIRAGGLEGGEILVDASQSSQFLSALLMAAPCAAQDVVVSWRGTAASLPYVHLTLAVMERFGVRHEWLAANRVLVPAPQSIHACEVAVEGDCSSASYFWAAAALTGGRVTTGPLAPDALQGDCAFLAILERMGCRVTWGETAVTVIGGPRLLPVDLDMNAMPDLVPTLAVLAAFGDGESRIRNVGHLRIKESDRLQVVALELARLGADVEEYADGLRIRGGGLKGGAVQAHDDHRIAMAFALVGLRVPGVAIHGAEAVAKSFPQFWDLFDRLGRIIP
jgi:3-phosphoshikimate 1-carboxyvinyltransferase